MCGSIQLKAVIAGDAGQGAVLAGIVLAEASMTAGLYTAQSSVTGAAVRSGAAESHVVIASEPVRYPYVESPDVLIALSVDALSRRVKTVAPGGVVLYDADDSAPCFPTSVKPLPIRARAALRSAGLPPGNENLLLLGAFSELENPISMRMLIAGLSQSLNMPSEIASAALMLGASLAGNNGAALP